MSREFPQELTKIGAIYGVYFLVQAYGYADGLSECAARFTINEALVSGFQHLTHIFRPWDRVAWPLTPVVGAFLLLFTLYLPEFLSRQENAAAKKATRIFFSVLAAVLVYALVSGSLGAERAVSIVHGSDIPSVKYPILLSLFYSVSSALLVAVFYKFIFPEMRWIEKANRTRLPWQELLTAVLIGCLLMAVYLGSLFDGTKDRMSDAAGFELQNLTLSSRCS